MPDLRLRLNKDVLVVAPLFTWQLIDPDMDDSECLEYLNILDGDLVRETHRRFRIAGAECTPTNTLDANRIALQAQGLEDALVEINRRGIRLVRALGFEHVFATVRLARPEVLSEQVAVLLHEEPDAIWLVGSEEGSARNDAIRCVRELTDLPIIAPACALPEVSEDADIIYSMGSSLEGSLGELRSLKQYSLQPLMICPDVGTPAGTTDKQRSMALNQLADRMVDFAFKALSHGAQFVGTAPGSPPLFTGALSAVLSGLDVNTGV